MAILPPSTNADYHGAKSSAWFLMFAGVMQFIPGCIHYFLPDGGAGVIAGIDLSTRGDTIIAIFAWFGALQIPFALLLFTIGWRYRSLIPLGLLALVIETGLMAYDAWFGKGALSGHHPPEHYGSPVVALLGLYFLILALCKPPAEKNAP